MEKFQGKYRIPSARAKWWDYSANGCYFITICTAGRQHIFGDIKDDIMQLSTIGKMVEEEWNRSFEIREELFCDAFVIMPNHIHALLWIDNDVSTVETHGVRLLQNDGNMPCRNPAQERDARRTSLQRLPKSVSSFIAGFKSAVTKRVNQYYNTPNARNTIWQPRFHDHIVRNSERYQYIANYIYQNPTKWIDDKFYSPTPS